MFSKIKNFLLHNTSTKQTVAKNSFWLTVSNFGGRLIKAGVVIYAARALGTAEYGVFSYAITLAGFLTLFMDPGINGIFMRDASKADEKERRTLFSTMLVVKIVLVFIGVGLVLFAAPVFSTLPGARALLPIVAVILAFDTMREFLTSLLRAEERMEWDAGIFLLTNAGILAFGFFFLYLNLSATSFSWAYVAGDVLGIALALWLVRKYFKRAVQHFNPRRIGPILRMAWPFAVTGALGVLLTNTDLLIISWMRNASEVGIYSAAIRIIQLLYIIPAVLQFSTLPVFSRFANKDNVKLRAALERTVKLILLASVPLALGGMILGTGIMQLVFGAAYAPGGLSLKILMLGLLFDFPAVVISSAVFAYNRQRNLIVASAIAAASNVFFDILLIPIWGIAGSAVATLLAQAFSNWYLWHMMKKINYFEVMPRMAKTVLAGTGMACVVAALFLLHVNIIANVMAGGAVYLFLLYVLREPLLKEIKELVMGVPTETGS
jgi:O-antigen/teichoic acid export membrane protein